MSRALALLLSLCALVLPSIARAHGRVDVRVPGRASGAVVAGAESRVGSPEFLQRDPEGYADSVNVYAVMGSDPIGRRDPTGRIPVALVPQTIIDNSQSAVDAVTNGAFTPRELKRLTELVIDAVRIYETSDALDLGNLDYADCAGIPEGQPCRLRNPIIMSPAGRAFLEKILSRLLEDDDLSPSDRRLVVKAKELWSKTIAARRVVIRVERPKGQ